MTKLATSITACLLLLGLSACSEANQAIDDTQKAASSAAKDGKKALQQVDLPNVDWSKYGDDLHSTIDDLAAKADCSGLRKKIDQADRQDDGKVVQYIQAKLEAAGC